MSLARILGKSRGRQSFVSDSRWVLPTSFIGLECEYEGVKDTTLPKHSFADFWTQHEEGSLKDSGAEYVFTTPLFGVDAYNAAEWLVAHAKDCRWKCTKRTGIHVHLDVRDLEVSQLAGMTILYAALEPLLYHWVGDGRDASHFCIPLYRADEALLGACSIVRSALQDEKDDSHTALGLAEEYQRYAGFNLQALHKFGSVEFRQLQTTHDFVRIVDWVNMLMSLKATAFKLPQSDGAVVRMIQRMGVQNLLTYVFPGDIAAKLYTPKSEEEFFTRGLPSSRDVAVHGCGNAVWVKRNFPKGEHKGFVKWIKSAKEMGKRDYYEDSIEIVPQEEEEDNPQIEQQPVWRSEVNFDAVFNAPPPQEIRAGLGLPPINPNWIEQNAAPAAPVYQPMPIAPPPIAPAQRNRIYENIMRAERDRVLRNERQGRLVGVGLPPQNRR
jgi:Putative amidoligase enzyme